MGYDMYGIGNDAYLRRSIGGIGGLREFLIRTGAGFDDYEFRSAWSGETENPAGRWPEHPGKEHFEQVPVPGWRDQDGNPVLVQGQPVTDEGRRYAEEAERFRRWRPERPGIPLHKLSDNSGWVVTAAECKEAVEAIRSWEQEGHRVDEYHEDVVRFLEVCADGDGFEVW